MPTPSTPEEILAAVQIEYPDAFEVTRIHKDSDLEWWVVNAEHETFAYAWFDEAGSFCTRPYKP